jgi:hypothetical protein
MIVFIQKCFLLIPSQNTVLERLRRIKIPILFGSFTDKSEIKCKDYSVINVVIIVLLVSIKWDKWEFTLIVEASLKRTCGNESLNNDQRHNNINTIYLAPYAM